MTISQIKLERLTLAPVDTLVDVDGYFVMSVRKSIDRNKFLMLGDRVSLAVRGSHIEFEAVYVLPEEGVFGEHTLLEVLTVPQPDVLKGMSPTERSHACAHCGKITLLPFDCTFCGSHFCVAHRLPESHQCLKEPPRTPLGRWQAKIAPFTARIIDREFVSNTERAHGTEQQKKGRERNWRARKIVTNILKVLAFSVFTIATIIPTILYAYISFLPEMKDVLSLIFLFGGDVLFHYIIPNVSYLIVWSFIVFSALRHKCKWWYHLILLAIGLWNWYTIVRIMLVLDFLKLIFNLDFLTPVFDFLTRIFRG